MRRFQEVNSCRGRHTSFNRVNTNLWSLQEEEENTQALWTPQFRRPALLLSLVPFATTSASFSKNARSSKITLSKACPFGAHCLFTRTEALLFLFTPLKRVPSILWGRSAINADALVRLEFYSHWLFDFSIGFLFLVFWISLWVRACQSHSGLECTGLYARLRTKFPWIEIGRPQMFN